MKKQLRTKAGMGRARADKCESKNGRKREEVEMKMGTTTDVCLQTQTVVTTGQDFLLEQIFSANFRKNKIET